MIKLFYVYITDLTKLMSLNLNNIQNKKQLSIMLSALIVIPLALYHASLKYDFLYELDDDWLVISNESIKAISKYGLYNGLNHLFLHDTTDIHYMPVTYLSYSIDYLLFGMNPYLIKLHNLLLHIISGILLFIFINLLLKRRSIAFIVSIIFLVHPMNIESIAWASCRKQGLFFSYFMASIIFYKLYLLNQTEKKAIYLYVLAILFWLISTLAKTTAITLPAVFVLLYIHQNRDAIKIKTILVQLIPMVPFVLFFWYVNTLANDRSYLIRHFSYSSLEHLLMAAYSYSFYWLKSIFPFPLVVFYPAPSEHSPLAIQYYILPAISCCLIGLMIYHYIKKQNTLFFSLGFYTITILPMLNLMYYPFGDLPMLVSNRYFYHTPLGIILYLVLLLDFFLKNKTLKISLLSVYTALLIILFKIHQPAFTNQFTMFENNAKYYPSEEFLYKLALLYDGSGQTSKALTCLDKADNLGTDIWFNNPWAYYLCRSRLYVKAGKYKNALKDINTAIKKKDGKTVYQDSLLNIDKSKIIQLIQDKGKNKSNIKFDDLKIYAKRE